MTTGIEILDKENGTVSISLLDILNSIEGGDRYCWSILHLWATGDLGNDKSMSDFEQSIENLSCGLVLSWVELMELASKFSQVIDMVIIGCAEKQDLGRKGTTEELYPVCDFVIEMNDSSSWLVHAKDFASVERLLNKFSQTRIV